ncbi:MAG: universal stress protein [Candidatus Nanohaloarchaea archaeon]
MYNSILLPVDEDEGVGPALEHAEELAEKFNAEIHLLNVVDVRDSFDGIDWKQVMEETEEHRRQELDNLREKLENKGLKASKEVRKGVPFKEINRVAEEKEIDLVVMPTHNRKGMERILLGSTTEKVLRTSEVPVLTVSLE